jgi:hypothetical protein
MQNLYETLKTNILFFLRTDNAFIDMILSMFVISIFSYIFNNKTKFYDFFHGIIKHIFIKENKCEISFIAVEYKTRSTTEYIDFPISYLSILNYLNRQNPCKIGINHLKEISTQKSMSYIDERSTIEDKFKKDKSTYTIDQENDIKINNDIFCKILNNIYESNDDKDKNKKKYHILKIFSFTKDINFLKSFVNQCIIDYEKFIDDETNNIQYFERYVTNNDGKQIFVTYLSKY